MRLAGLDIGTTGCKVTVYEADGKFLGRVYSSYEAVRSDGAHTIDANDIWTSTCDILRQAGEEYPGIGAIGVASFGETFVMLDADDKPLCLSLLYTDPRGTEQCEKLMKAVGKKQIIETTGLNPHSMYSLPKLMWLRENNPDVFKKAKRVMQMGEYIVYKLTGTAQVDYSLASRTMAFDIKSLKWSSTLQNAADIDFSLFSKPVPTGTAAGNIKESLALEFGLQRETLVVSAGQDQIAAAIGSGVFDETSAVDGAGTVECMTPIFSTYNATAMSVGNYAIVPFINGYATYAFSYTGGALIKWFIENLLEKHSDSGLYAELERGYNGRPTGLLVLPHFAGAATPYMDNGARGAIIGLATATMRSDVYLAVMEGVCYEMRLNKELLANAGVSINCLRATGGGANSRVWMQMKADILNIPITALETEEAGTTGSVMLAGVASGLFNGLQKAAHTMIRERETFVPNLTNAAEYTQVYERYKKLYDAVRPLI